MSKKALIAMSGGVDSSVAAALTVEAGYDCIGVTMKLYDNGDVNVSSEKACCTLSDTEDAASVCRRLGIPYRVFNFTDDFGKEVIGRFVAAYKRGDTPNPCIDCNRFMKFQKLYMRAELIECDKIVTGHYARVEFDEQSGKYKLLKAKNLDKDQSYVLYFLNQQQLAHTDFPLGRFESKEEVRSLARDYGFVNAKKHDSQDICFVQNESYGDFIERYAGLKFPEGDFVDQNGNVLGRHKGLIRYTVGQRKGLGLSLPAPLYVKGKDMEHNRVILSPEDGLYTKNVVANDFNFVSGEPFSKPVRVTAKPRYRAKEAPAVAEVRPDGTVKIVFDEPQRAVTTGQAIVLYDGDEVMGGGTIISTE